MRFLRYQVWEKGWVASDVYRDVVSCAFRLGFCVVVWDAVEWKWLIDSDLHKAVRVILPGLLCAIH